MLKAEKENNRLLNERNIEVLNMNNLRYIIDDIKSMKVKYSIIFVQLLVGLGIFLYLFQTSCAYLKTEQEIQKKTAQENIYMFQDITSDAKFSAILNNKEKLKKLKIWKREIDQNLKVNNVRYYTGGVNVELPISHKRGINRKKVSKEFIEYFQLKGNFDSNFAEKWNQKNTDKSYIILGASVGENYRVGDKFEVLDGEYEVVGVLKKGESFIEPSHSATLICLDEYALTPFEFDETKALSYCMYIDNTYYVTDNQESLRYISQLSSQLGLFDLELTDFSYQLSCIKRDAQDNAVVYGMFLVISTVFCFVGIVGSMTEFINDHKREFAIHMLMGARSSDIMMRVFMLILLQYVGASIVIGIINRGVDGNFVITCVYEAILLGCAMISPIYTLKKQSIQTILRRAN